MNPIITDTAKFQCSGPNTGKMTFEDPENKRHMYMYGSQSTLALVKYHTFLLISGFSNACHFACVCPTAKKCCCCTFSVLINITIYTAMYCGSIFTECELFSSSQNQRNATEAFSATLLSLDFWVAVLSLDSTFSKCSKNQIHMCFVF